ncbi:MAG: hypothetical protein GY938_17610 [Ketobacter sp.]|nr:hypothetical protein [Ketobacter sp.]
MKYQGCVISFLLALMLYGCGGGGGGGSDTAPANVDTPNPETPEELQTGMFTDAPVTGLRYTQGRREGYTESGRFTYDARSSDPVCFFVGEVRLGCVAGSAVVTPYHLSSPGQPAGLQSGYNISRLLISLDESIGPEITLPQASRNARGYVDFYLSDGLFATDSVVNDLIERYAPEGSLSTRQDVDAHIADNADVQQSIQALTQTLESEISDITIRWNSTLAEAGVLAHIEARSGGQPQQTEHLYLEVSQYNTQLYLSNLTYIDPNGDYTYVRLGRDGLPTRVNNNGEVKAYLNMLNTSLESWVATSSYQPEKAGYLIGDAGIQSRVETRYVSKEMASETLTIASNLGRENLSNANLLRMASYAAAIVQSIECAGTSDQACGSKLQDSLLLAQVDSGYGARMVSWMPEAIAPDLCLPLEGMPASENCGFAPNLQEFNVVMSSRLDSFTGVSAENQFLSERELEQDLSGIEGVYLYLHDRAWGVPLRYEFICHFKVTSRYKFSDDSYYVQIKGENIVCKDAYVDVSPYYIPYSCGGNCDEVGFSMPADWPGFTAKRNLAFRVVKRMFSSGYGQILNYEYTREGERFYIDSESSNILERFGSTFTWYDSLDFNATGEDFYASGVADDGQSLTPMGVVLVIDDDSNVVVRGKIHGMMNFRDQSGTEILIEFQ